MHTDGRTDRQPKEIPSVPRVETKLLPRSRVAIPGCEATAAEDPASDPTPLTLLGRVSLHNHYVAQ